jgi:hypothetical protein
MCRHYTRRLARRGQAGYTEIMQLREARLCLDCEELHTMERCPVCASEAFAFVTRWLPVDERRALAARKPPQAQASAPPPSRRSRLLKAATAGVALATAAQWLWRALPVDPPDPTRERRNPGDGNRRRTDE